MIQALVYGNGGQESERAVMVLEAQKLGAS